MFLACVVAEGIVFWQDVFVLFLGRSFKGFLVHAKLYNAWTGDYVNLHKYTFSNTLVFMNLRTYKQLM